MGSHCKVTLLLFLAIWFQGSAQGATSKAVAAAIERNLLGLLQVPEYMNVVFVIDAAGGYTEKRNFQLVQNFASKLVMSIPVIRGRRVAIISASSRGAVYYSLRNPFSKAKALSAVHSVIFGGHKSLLGGINEAILLIKKQKHWRTRHNVIVQISTGVDQKASYESLRELRKRLTIGRIHLFTFALYHASYNQLSQITSKPLKNHSFRISQYLQLRKVTKLLAREATEAKGKPVFDRCHRLCLKVGKKLLYCTRIRKDFTSMSATERTRWINTYKLASRKQPYKKTFDALVLLHKVLFETSIHQKNQFLPWHRWYILQLENLLRKIDCKVTMPYWDWSLWSHKPWDKSHLWSSKSSGFSGNGTAPNFCVTDGPFAAQRWQVAPSARQNNLTCLRRTQNGNPPDAPAVQILLRTPVNKASLFEENLRVNFHNRVHCNFADEGHMCSLDSAASPEFFLHHGFVDKTWYDWQKQSRGKKKALFSKLRAKKMRGTNYTPSDLHDLRRQPGGVRVIYDNPTHDHAKVIFKILEGMSVKTLDNLPRSKFSPISRHALKVFHVGNRELALSKRFEKMIQPTHLVKDKRLHGVDKELGVLL